MNRFKTGCESQNRVMPGLTFYLELWEGDILSVSNINRRRQQEIRNDSLAFKRGPEVVPLVSHGFFVSLMNSS